MWEDLILFMGTEQLWEMSLLYGKVYILHQKQSWVGWVKMSLKITKFGFSVSDPNEICWKLVYLKREVMFIENKQGRPDSRQQDKWL